jgi:hypothetical protein
MKNLPAVSLIVGLIVLGEGAGLSATPKSIFLSFNGTSSAVAVANSAALGEGSGPLTVSVWVKPAVLGTAMIFVSKMSGASVQWVLARDAANRMLFVVTNTTGQAGIAVAASATNDLNWHHVTGVFDGATVSLYVDAVSAATPAALSGSIPASHGGVCLGSSWNAGAAACSTGSFLNGYLDEVRIYRRALPQSEIQATKDVEIAGNETGLAVYYNFNDAAGQVAYDLALGYHGILGNTLSANPSDPVWVGSGPDTTKPIAIVLYPTDTQTLTDQVNMASLALDNVGVVGVQYRLDSANFGPEVTTPPFSMTLDPAPLSIGGHNIEAIARDLAGNRSVGYPISFIKPGTIPPKPSGCFNQSLGNGWSCIDSNAVAGSVGSTVTRRLFHDAAVPAHALIVLFTDADMRSGDGTMTCRDNAQNVFTRAPMGNASIDNAPLVVRSVSYWYTLDAKAKASGYEASCTFSSTGVIGDLDLSVMVFKHSSGLPSPGIDTFIPWAEGYSGPGPCPCEMVPGGQTLVANYAGDLIIGGGNMNGGPTRIDPPFVGVDGDFYLTYGAYFTTAATTSAPGSYRLRWYESRARDGMASTMFAFRPPL